MAAMPKRARRIALERVASDTTLSRKTTSKKMNTSSTRFDKIVGEGKSGKKKEVPGTPGAKTRKTTSKKKNTSSTRFNSSRLSGGGIRNGPRTPGKNLGKQINKHEHF